MSAIWGCIDFSGEKVEEVLKQKMLKTYESFKIDRFLFVEKKNAFMSCGLQYIKLWSENDILPIYDEKSNILFTADCLVDNRKEVMKHLGIYEELISDGELLFKAYQKWGADLGKWVYGSYSYAAYHFSEEKLVLGVDQISSRLLHYQKVGDKLYFSTRIESILDASLRKELNEEWLSLFIGITVRVILTNPMDTVYKGVYRVEAGHYNVFTKTSMESIKYYDIDDVQPLKLHSDEEYKREFRALFQKCVEESIDGLITDPAVTLTRGFDSSTTAAFAAKKLARENKKLHGYTNVPIDSYVSNLSNKYAVADESEGVLEFAKMYPNVTTTFLTSPESDGFSNVEEILGTYESLYKSALNIDWLSSIYRKVGEDDRRLLLVGQMGNMTISFGSSTEYYIIEMIRRKKYLKALLILNEFGKKYRLSRKNLLLKHYKFLRQKSDKRDDYLENSLLRGEKAKEQGISKTDPRLYHNEESEALYKESILEKRKYVLNNTIFAHVADFACMMGLKNGFAVRDPSCDPRLIKFCNSLPLNVFLNEKCETRRLVRYYCKDLLPDSFTVETAPRGAQSSDWRERVLSNWERIYPDIEKMVYNPKVLEFYDKEKICNLIQKFKEIPESESLKNEFNNMGIFYIVSKFLEKNQNFENKI